VVSVDPDGAAKRRDQEEKENARVRFWRETAGTCALLGAGLPTDEALKAHAHVEQRAQQYRAAGVKRGIDILRVVAYLDLLNGTPMADRLVRFEAEDGTAGDGAGTCGRGSTERAGGDSGSSNPPPGAPGESRDPESGPESTEPEPAASGSGEPGLAAEVNLTLRHIDIPFVTAAGYAQRFGEARSLGVLDPDIARKLAEAAARHPDSTFCLTVVNHNAQAIGHGCCKPRPQPGSRQGQRDRSAASGFPPSRPPSAFTLTPSAGPGPPGGFGSWILTLPGQARELIVDLHAVPTGECGHQRESARHDPGDLLRHLVSVRDGKCGFPSCSRHARESDFEHATPFEKGGRTCGCNCWSCSRSCHQVKQSDGWDVTETKPGYHQWKTPSGRTYTQEPWRYPS
jgi:hypothetical protein